MAGATPYIKKILNLSPDLVDAVELFAQRRGLTFTAAVREGLRLWLTEQSKQVQR